MIDDTTQDWFALQGREQSGWTAIQFKRSFDTCDIRDYPVKVSNIRSSRLMSFLLICSLGRIN